MFPSCSSVVVGAGGAARRSARPVALQRQPGLDAVPAALQALAQRQPALERGDPFAQAAQAVKWPRRAQSSGRPRPLSSIVSRSDCGSASARTLMREAPLWRSALVSASCATR